MTTKQKERYIWEKKISEADRKGFKTRAGKGGGEGGMEIYGREKKVNP